jgi:hypothetical protein
MSIGPVDIEFVVKGDVGAQLKRVSQTVAGESNALKAQVADFGKFSSESYNKAATSISAMKDKLEGLKKIYAELSAEGRNSEFGKIISGQVRELESSIESAGNANKGFLQTMKDLPGPIGSAVSGMEGMIKASLRFIATPIGAVIAAIVIALKTLTAWFKSSEEGENALAQITTGFKVVLDNLLDPIEAVGEWLYKAFANPKQALIDLVEFLKGQVINRLNAVALAGKAIKEIFQGDFKTGFNDLGDANLQFLTGIKDAGQKFQSFVTDTKNQINQGIEYQKQLNALEAEQRDWSIERKKLETDIAELRLKATDMSLPEKERLGYMKQAASEVNKMYSQNIAFAQRKLDITRGIKSLDDLTKKDKQDLVDLEVNLIGLQGQKASELKALSGKTNALAKQEESEQNAKTKAQLEYYIEIGKQRISDQFEIEQQSLDLQKESAEKSRQQAELDYRKALAELANQKAEKLKKLNEATGGIDKESGKPTAAYTAELPEIDQKQIDDKVILAAKTRDAKIVEINKKAAEEIQKIWQEVTDYRLTGMDKELAAVKKKFDDELKLAKAAGDDKLQAAIEERRAAANSEIKQKYALEDLDFQKEIELQKNEIQAGGFDREEQLMKLNFETFRKYQQRKIDILKASSDPEDQKRATLLQGALDADIVNKELQDLKRTFNDIANALSTITSGLTEAGALTEAEGKAIGDTLSAIASGNPLQMAAEAIKEIISMFPDSAATKYAEQIERINEALREQQRLIDQASRRGDEEAQRKADIILKQNKLAADEKALAAAQKKMDNKIFHVGPVWKADVKAVEDLTLAVEKDKEAIEDAQQAYDDFVGGGVTQNTIADIIAQGFKEGKTSVDDFADYMNDVLLDAVMKIFSAEILGPQIDAITTYMSFALSDKILTPEEVAQINAMTKELADNNKILWDNLTNALDLPSAEAETETKGLTGAIRNITEETGGAIEGALMGLKIDLKNVILEMAKGQLFMDQGLSYLSRISANTEYNRKLEGMAADLNELLRVSKERL